MDVGLANAVLKVSISGAGIILAVNGVLLPLAKFAIPRLRGEPKQVSKDLKKLAKKIKKQPEAIAELQAAVGSSVEESNVSWIEKELALASFLLYMFSIVYALVYLFNQQIPVPDAMLASSLLATVGLAVIGAGAINAVFEQVK